MSYEFAPGEPDDGVTVDIPLARLNQVSAEEFGWQVPGLREELVTELIRSLPKQLRTMFVPAPDTARAVLPRLGPAHGDLLAALAAELSRLGGVQIPRSAWDRVPAARAPADHVPGGRGRPGAGPGKDLAGLRQELRPRLQADADRGGRRAHPVRAAHLGLGTLPRVFSQGEVRAYPALADTGDAVDIRLFETGPRPMRRCCRGTRRLLLLRCPSGARAVASRLPVSAKLAHEPAPLPGHRRAAGRLRGRRGRPGDHRAGGPAWDAAGFDQAAGGGAGRTGRATADVVALVARALGQAHQVEASLAGPQPPVLRRVRRPAPPAVRADLPGFIAATGAGGCPT